MRVLLPDLLWWLDVLQAAAGACWHDEGRFARWALGDALPGEAIRLWAAFSLQAGTPGALTRNVAASVVFQGPPDETLSGIALDSGLDGGRLQESSAVLFGRAVLTPA